MSDTTLSKSDQIFFTQVARAAFVNPFSVEREVLIRKISKLPEDAPLDVRFQAVLRKLKERVLCLAQPILGRVRGQEPDMLETALLFLVFHEFMEGFDRHIQLQLDQGEKPIKIPFGREIMGRLSGLGFSTSDSGRYVGLFFQLRRAFFFISHRIIGEGPSMIQLRCQLWNHVFTFHSPHYWKYFWNKMEDFSTLLTGETGTGKGTAAAAIGQSGFIPFDIQENKFVESFLSAFNATNLAEFPETLLEAELFGYRKGAFTGAVDSHEGIFARCSRHGSIFLDEIGEVPEPVQIKLLNVLEGRTFSPVGSHEKKRFNGRIIAATNKDLDKLRLEHKFRDDFYYRLCSDTIVIPPLRVRISEDPEELVRLLRHMIYRFTERAAPEIVELCHDVIIKELGIDYAWPGNVRELQQCIRRIILTHSAREGSGKPLLLSPTGTRENVFLKDFQNGHFSADQLLGYYCVQLYDQLKSYDVVGRKIGLDRRTVKKYIDLLQ